MKLKARKTFEHNMKAKCMSEMAAYATYHSEKRSKMEMLKAKYELKVKGSVMKNMRGCLNELSVLNKKGRIVVAKRDQALQKEVMKEWFFQSL